MTDDQQRTNLREVARYLAETFGVVVGFTRANIEVLTHNRPGTLAELRLILSQEIVERFGASILNAVHPRRTVEQFFNDAADTT